MRWMTATVVCGAALLAFGQAASAHPLGNFTISHHVGVHIEPDITSVTVVFDFAEIPAFQIRRELTPNTTLNQDQLAELGRTTCREALPGLRFADGGRQIELSQQIATAEFRPGEGNLDTLLVTCELSFATSTQFPSELSVEDATYPDRIGWREIVVTSDGIDIVTEALVASPTDVLRRYPSDGPVRDDRTATVQLIGVGPGTQAAAPLPESAATLAQPTLVDRIGSVLQGDRLDSAPLALAAAAALGLGFVHALAPGHGKTLVAAYLVGNRGTWRHALGLGFTVAVSHTVGVAVLGALTLAASAAFEPAAFYPYLALASGLIVLGLGAYLVWKYTNRSDGHHHHNHSHPVSKMHHHSRVTWRGLAALGISGGLVPSASAVVLLLGALALGRPGLGLTLVVLFGTGMATALIAAGLLVVVAERWGSTHLGHSPASRRIRRHLPRVMAWLVVGVGLVLVTNAVLALP